MTQEHERKTANVICFFLFDVFFVVATNLNADEYPLDDSVDVTLHLAPPTASRTKVALIVHRPEIALTLVQYVVRLDSAQLTIVGGVCGCVLCLSAYVLLFFQPFYWRRI